MGGRSPKYFSTLSQSDQEGYWALQDGLLKASKPRQRGQRLTLLADVLSAARAFAQRGQPDDWTRCCVCGVCYLQDGIAINSHQLRFLTNKCKSSINGALKMMGYTTISARGDVNPDLVNALPNLKGRTHDLRLWSVRRPPDSTVFCSPIDTEKPDSAASLAKMDESDLSQNGFFREHEKLPDHSFETYGCDFTHDRDGLNW
jgi:hypothetical protein